MNNKELLIKELQLFIKQFTQHLNDHAKEYFNKEVERIINKYWRYIDGEGNN